MGRKQFAILIVLAISLVAFMWAEATFTTYMPFAPNMPTNTPTITPTPTVTPTQVPCPNSNGNASDMTSNNGLRGDFFRMKDNKTCFDLGENAWFQFGVTNISSVSVDVGGLGAIWCTDKPNQCTQASYGDHVFGPGSGLAGHEDHMNIPSSGTYQVRLGVCWLDTRPLCMQNPGSWHYLSGPITVTIR